MALLKETVGRNERNVMKICRIVILEPPCGTKIVSRSYKTDQHLSDDTLMHLPLWGVEKEKTDVESRAGTTAASFFDLLKDIGGLEQLFVLRRDGFYVTVTTPEQWETAEPQIFDALRTAYGFDKVEVVDKL